MNETTEFPCIIFIQIYETTRKQYVIVYLTLQ